MCKHRLTWPDQFTICVGDNDAESFDSRRSVSMDRRGRTFADVLHDAKQPFDLVITFFNHESRQRRMEESETHHDRPPFAGVVRELDSQPAIDQFLATQDDRRAKRFRQAIGVVVRMIMERRGRQKTGPKGSLGVCVTEEVPFSTAGRCRNTGGLAMWFLRAERYQLSDSPPPGGGQTHGTSECIDRE